MIASPGWVPARADIIWIEYSPHVGKEMPARHPMLVTSPKEFNEATGIVIGFPMTHAAYNADNPFAVTINWPDGEVSYVLGFQPKSFDWKKRNAALHPRGGGHVEPLKQALTCLALICGK